MTSNESRANYILLTPSAQAPVRGSASAAGLDVCADFLDAEGKPRKLFDGRTHHDLTMEPGKNAPSFILKPHQRILVPLGIAMSTSLDIYTRVAPRSGLALKQGLSILGGVCDADYTGEIGAICHNTDPVHSIEITHGMRIAQLVLTKVSLLDPAQTTKLELTERAAGGFGSTGV